MSGTIFTLIMNAVIIVLLGATIVYTMRLSLYLKAFRNNRRELDKLVQELSAQIDKANTAIAGMRAAAKDSGKGLQDKINDARALSDELQMMTQSANKLSGRLEKQIDTRPKAQAPEEEPRKKRKDPAPKPAPSFAIRDSEFGRDDEEAPDDTGMQSRAERDLYEAMQKRGRTP